MMGEKEPGEKLYYSFSLEDKVPQGHILRRIAEAVDFSFVHKIARPYYSHTGKPSVDPVVVLKMALIGYIYGISSERRLASELPLNLAWLWFLGYDIDEETPDHSILSKARARFGPDLYREFFCEVVRVCDKAGLVSGDKIIVDSTLVPANASLDSLVSHAIWDQLPPPREFVERLFAENEVPEDSDTKGENRSGRGMPSGRIGDSLQHQENSRADAPGQSGGSREQKTVSKLPANKRRVSRSDPDCSIVFREKQGVMMAYKVHLAVDGGKDRVVTAVCATPGDAEVFPTLMWRHATAFGAFPSEAVADSAYGTHGVYSLLRQMDIFPSIPRKKTWGRKWLGISSFTYDSERDLFVCPEGNTLKRQGAKSGNKADRYRTVRGSCSGCPRKETCAKGESRSIAFHPDDEVLLWASARSDTDRARESVRKRKEWAETVVADLKGQHNLDRAQFRGLWKMEIQAYLSAAAHNLKRLAADATRFGEGVAASPKPFDIAPPHFMPSTRFSFSGSEQAEPNAILATAPVNKKWTFHAVPS